MTCEEELCAELLPQPESTLLDVIWLEVDDMDGLELELKLEELYEFEAA